MKLAEERKGKKKTLEDKKKELLFYCFDILFAGDYKRGKSNLDNQKLAKKNKFG